MFNLQTLKTYSATCTIDLEIAIDLLAKRFPKARIILVGASMGGILVSKYLKSYGSDTPVKSSVIFSSPFNPYENMKDLEETWTNFLLLNFPIAHALRQNYKNSAKMDNEGILNHDKIVKSVSIRDFDESFTVPVFGYESVNDYYRDGKLCSKTLQSIQIPTLFVNSDDDPFSRKDSKTI